MISPPHRIPRTGRSTRPRRILVPAVLGALVLLAGCGGSGVTQSRLEESVTTSFSRLYVLQQQAHGRQVSAAELRTQSSCFRGADPSTPSVGSAGAGDDWTCLITFDVQPGTPVQSKYTLVDKTNGCFTADGEGPAEINGQADIVTPDGQSVTNPLWRFDGCFATL